MTQLKALTKRGFLILVGTASIMLLCFLTSMLLANELTKDLTRSVNSMMQDPDVADYVLTPMIQTTEWQIGVRAYITGQYLQPESGECTYGWVDPKGFTYSIEYNFDFSIPNDPGHYALKGESVTLETCYTK